MFKLSRREFVAGTAATGVGAATGLTPAFAQGEPLKVGVVHQGPFSEVGWEGHHMRAWKALEKELGDKVEVKALDNVQQAQDAERVFRQLAAQGCGLIFGTTFSQYATLRKLSPSIRKAHFECCAGIETTPNLGVFEARSYEGNYITGIAAGKMTKSNVLGWVGAFPVPQVIYNLNGFMLGVRSVNPNAVCKVVWVNAWSDPAKEKDAVNALIAQGADVLSGSPNTAVQGLAAEQKGVWSVGMSGDFSEYVKTKQLTSFVLDWAPAYIEPAKAVLAGTWKPESRWRGLGEGGFVKMTSHSPELPPEVVQQMADAEKAIIAGELHPFTGPIKDQAGNLKVPAGKTMPDEELRSINWLVEGVQGTLPRG